MIPVKMRKGRASFSDTSAWLTPHELKSPKSDKPIFISYKSHVILSKYSWKGNDGVDVSWSKTKEGNYYTSDISESDHELLLSFKEDS